MLVQHRENYNRIPSVEKVHAVGKPAEQRTTERPTNLWKLARHQTGTFYDAIELSEETSSKAYVLGLIPFLDRANVEPRGPTNEELGHRFFASA
jgi:hypothetical protein